MQKSTEKQGGKKGRSWLRAFLLGMGVGGGIAVLFLILSLKVADSALSYNPYRWMSSLHEWLAIIVLIFIAYNNQPKETVIDKMKTELEANLDQVQAEKLNK